MEGDRINKARELAKRAHAGQVRKYTGIPYITHPMDVYDCLCKLEPLPGAFVDMACAAYLHDVLEDCPQIAPEEIGHACGLPVLDLVQQLTNPSKGSKAPRAERKRMDREHIASVSYEAKVLKLIDRTCNLRDMDGISNAHPADAKFIALYAAESRLLLDALRGTHAVMEVKLEYAIAALERAGRNKT